MLLLCEEGNGEPRASQRLELTGESPSKAISTRLTLPLVFMMCWIGRGNPREWAVPLSQHQSQPIPTSPQGHCWGSGQHSEDFALFGASQCNSTNSGMREPIPAPPATVDIFPSPALCLPISRMGSRGFITSNVLSWLPSYLWQSFFFIANFVECPAVSSTASFRFGVIANFLFHGLNLSLL